MATALTPTVVPTGDSALTVVFGDTLDLELNDRVLSLDRWLIDEPIPGVLETVPAFTTLLIRFDTSVLSHGEVISEIERRLRQPGSMAAHEAGRRQWTIPARYGGVHGPDLSEVADLLGKSEESVVSAHAALRLRVLMLGFAPGFAYLGLADDIWDIPRPHRGTTRGARGLDPRGSTTDGAHRNSDPDRDGGTSRRRRFDPSIRAVLMPSCSARATWWGSNRWGFRSTRGYPSWKRRARRWRPCGGSREVADRFPRRPFDDDSRSRTGRSAGALGWPRVVRWIISPMSRAQSSCANLPVRPRWRWH